jgi:pyruvate formate lyase activating enzyme
MAWETGRELGLHYVYIGNVPGHKADHTYCPSCNKMVIHRRGYFVKLNGIKGGQCTHCKNRLAGVWE